MTNTAEKFAAEVRTIAATAGIIQAIHAYNKVINDNPSDVGFKNEFIKFIQTMHLRIESNTLKNLMTHCLTDPATEWHNAGVSWYTLLLNDPSFKPLPKLIKIEKYPDFVKKITAAANAPFFNDPYFIYGLGRLTVRDVDFERFLTFLRRYMLEYREISKLPPSVPYVLSRYCRRTEYVFFESEEEKAILKQLQLNERDQVLLSCYRPIEKLGTVANASPAWTALEAEQINTVKAIRDTAAKITPLTKIDDSVSALVRGMYEKYPYPAWDSISLRPADEVERAALAESKKVLSAGCGTGKEAIELAIAYPHTQVLGIDLSTTSLAYAQNKAQEMGVVNVTFQQADILKLPETGLEFDFIATSGVLHHMQEPLKGWAALTAVLKPKGVMRVALYSSRARWAVHEAIAAKEKKGYGRADDDIRRFRHDTPKLMGGKAWKHLTTYHDYYYLNECCDMLFHVQEQDYTPLELAGAMEELRLQFEKFFVSDKTMENYRKMFKDDAEGKSLINWDKFEHKNPDTFRGMLQFWCRKK